MMSELFRRNIENHKGAVKINRGRIYFKILQKKEIFYIDYFE